MKKFNNARRSLEELLTSLQLEEGCDANEEMQEWLDEEDSADGFPGNEEAEEILDAANLEAGKMYRISKGPVLFLPAETRKEAGVYYPQDRELNASSLRWDFGFREEDLAGYMPRRRPRERRVCPNWDEAAGTISNAPKKISYRELLKRRRG
jgi:hypothetical protein